MIRRSADFLLPGMVLLMCLGAQYLRQLSMIPGLPIKWLGGFLTCFDSVDQWMIGTVLAIYFMWLSRLRHVFWRRTNPGEGAALGSSVASGFRRQEIAFLLLAVLAVGSYIANYPISANGNDFLVLFGGLTIGRAAGAFRMWHHCRHNSRDVHTAILAPLIFLLALAALFHPDMQKNFEYRGGTRWIGPWDNPNSFGMLMGMGLVLSIGQILRELGSSGKTHAVWPTSGSPGFLRLSLVLHSIAVLLMGIGLIKSYSRGAWVGTVCGLIYLRQAWKRKHFLNDESVAQRADGLGMSNKSNYFWFRRRRSAVVLLISLLIIGFWSFRYTEQRLVRRSLSVANVNDFSWRNRVEASVGALQMIADRPWFGFGWNQPGEVYDAFYRPAKMVEGYVIFLNDYFMLAMILGLPALACLLAYMYSKFASGHRSYFGNRASVAPVDWSMAVSRAGLLVLIIGFLPEHGLFYIGTGAPFWILLELGSAGNE